MYHLALPYKIIVLIVLVAVSIIFTIGILSLRLTVLIKDIFQQLKVKHENSI